MAIQLPNPGLGDGQTGDNEFVMWTKVKDNFTDQTNAASKLVGENVGNIPLAQNIRKAFANIGTVTPPVGFDFNNIQAGDYLFYERKGTPYPNQPPADYATLYAVRNYSSTDQLTVISHNYANGGVITRGKQNNRWSEWATHYHSLNTTKDVGTGFLKVSSPVLHVYNDKIDKIHEAEQLDITVDKKGVGHYEIHGTTGLRQNDGWNMSPPRDIHGNVRCMIEVTEKDGVITVKTYKRKFDLELAAIVHDYDNPLDIPDGTCVELRFNDLPYENLDDTQMEV